MKGMVFLIIAVVAEVIGTSALKASNGFSQMTPSIIVVVSYGFSFYLLGLALQTIPLGAGYAMWSGIGTALTAIIGIIVWKEAMPLASILGILFIIAGVILLNINNESA